MSVSVNAAAQVYRDAVRSSVAKSSTRYMIEAAAMILAGALAIIFPVISSQAFMVMIGWLLVIAGLIQAVGLISSHCGPFAGLQVVSIALALLIGFLILRSPTLSLVTLSALIIVFIMIEGVSKIVWAMTIRPLEGWIWVLASGVLGVVLSVILVVSLDNAATWLVALLVGIQLISAGASLFYLAWSVRKAAKTSKS